MGTVCILFFNGFDLLKVALNIYFWKLGEDFLSILRTSNNFGMARKRLVIIPCALFSIGQKLLQLPFFVYPLVQIWQGKPCSEEFGNY